MCVCTAVECVCEERERRVKGHRKVIDGQVLKRENARVCGKRKKHIKWRCRTNGEADKWMRERVTGKEWWRKWSRGE